MPLEITRDRLPELLRAIHSLGREECLVGIPGEADPREEAGIGNAAIGYIQEHGAPEINLPARPHLVPGVRNAQDDVAAILRNGADRATEGDTQAAHASLVAAGIAAVNSVIAYINTNIPPPLSPKTIAARRRRSKGSTYRRLATTAADVVALIDSGQYRRAITYVIRARGG